MHWDSAALYGDSEELVGRWFQRTGKRREVRPAPIDTRHASLITQQIFLATKFGNHVTPEGGREIRNDREYIHSAIAKSLQRLQTDYLDLLYWFVAHYCSC